MFTRISFASPTPHSQQDGEKKEIEMTAPGIMTPQAAVLRRKRLNQGKNPIRKYPTGKRYREDCQLDWCEREYYAKGYCKRHYHQHRRGKPFTEYKPPVKPREVHVSTTIDKEESR